VQQQQLQLDTAIVDDIKTVAQVLGSSIVQKATATDLTVS